MKDNERLLNCLVTENTAVVFCCSNTDNCGHTEISPKNATILIKPLCLLPLKSSKSVMEYNIKKAISLGLKNQVELMMYCLIKGQLERVK